MKVRRKINGRDVSSEDWNSRPSRLNEILESRQFPGLHTDDTFLSGRGSLSKQLGTQTQQVVNAAKRHGYTPGVNDVYEPQLARFPGDPRAFLKHGSARGQVRRVCEAEGMSCSGSVNVKGRKVEAPPVPLGDDIVRDFVASKGDSALAAASLSDQRIEAVKVHGKGTPMNSTAKAIVEKKVKHGL